LYELKRTSSERVRDLRIHQQSYGPAISSDFVMTSRQDGEQTRFSVTYGTEGPYARVPLRVTFQPRWWLQVELTIDDARGPVGSADGALP
jgi:hypothetical protein